MASPCASRKKTATASPDGILTAAAVLPADADKTKPVYSLPLMDKKATGWQRTLPCARKVGGHRIPHHLPHPLAAARAQTPIRTPSKDTVTLNDADYSGRAVARRLVYGQDIYNRGHADRPACHPVLSPCTPSPRLRRICSISTPLGGEYDGDNPHIAANSCGLSPWAPQPARGLTSTDGAGRQRPS